MSPPAGRSRAHRAAHIVSLVVHKAAPPLRYLGTVSGLGPLDEAGPQQYGR